MSQCKHRYTESFEGYESVCPYCRLDESLAEQGRLSSLLNASEARVRELETANTAMNKIAVKRKNRLTELEASEAHWRANHDEMVRRNAVLMQRPDLDVTRIPVYEAMKAEIERLKEEKAQFSREANSLATYIWKHHYQEESPNWSLCDTPIGVMTQLDNMYAGLRTELNELKAKLSRYDQGVEVEGVVEESAATILNSVDNSGILKAFNLPNDMIGKKVICNVMAKEVLGGVG